MQKTANAPDKPLHGCGLPLEGLGIIEFNVANIHTELFGLPGFSKQFGGRKKNLGRDTAPQEARSADLVLFDQGDSRAQLSSPYGSDITAGTAADYAEIKLFHRSVSPAFRWLDMANGETILTTKDGIRNGANLA